MAASLFIASLCLVRSGVHLIAPRSKTGELWTPLLMDAASNDGPAPLQGMEPWGRWSNQGPTVQLGLIIDNQARMEDVRVEVAEGWLCAGVEDERDLPPIVFGRFAQPVNAVALTWGLEASEDGRSMLCIDIPKRPGSRGVGATVDCTSHSRGTRICATACIP